MRPIVWLTRGESRAQWLSDAVQGSDVDHSLHPHAFAVDAAASLIERVTAPGDLVLDPFCRSVGVACACACARLGRRFLGLDADPSAVRVARGRIAS